MSDANPGDCPFAQHVDAYCDGELPAALEEEMHRHVFACANCSAAVRQTVEISDSIKKGLDIVPVSRMDEVLARAMVRKPEAIEWDEEKAKPTETSVSTEPAVEADSSTLTAH